MTDKPKILLVDDRPENLMALERVLAGLGRDLELIKANSGNEALGLTLEHNFALALMDVQMPEMDGFETVELMHQSKEAEHLPVIFVSAVYSGEYYRIKGVEVGAIDFIEKPIVPEILLGKVRLFLDLYDIQIQLQQAKDGLEEKVRERTAALAEAHKQLQDATVGMVQSEKLSALGEMSAGVAHELNQPLNVIKIIAQELKIDKKRGRFDENELFEEHLPTIIKQVDRMAAIINHMRLYSRTTAGKEEKACDLNEAVEGVLTLIGHQLLVHNIKVDKQGLTPGLPAVKLDQIRLEQVIMNIITNARHAMESFRKKGEITIATVKKDGNEVELTIRDTGGGVPKEVREKIFEPFFTTKEAGKGTGLGLSVCNKIVSEAGGRIELEVADGEGSTFHVLLPAVGKGEATKLNGEGS